MPPTAKVTREIILSAALDITRREGFDAVNARSLAARLGCSTRPIFTCYENMEAVKADFLEYAFAFYEQRATAWGEGEDPFLALPLTYLRFAREEPLLFRALRPTVTTFRTKSISSMRAWSIRAGSATG